MKAMLTSAALILMTGSAFAADAVVYEQPPEAVVIEPGFSWTGLYIGANVGYSWGDFDQSFEGTSPALLDPLILDFDDDVDGISGGGQAGFNWQVNNFVFGVEADIQAANLEAIGTQLFTLPALGSSLSADVTTEIDWFATARLRAGFLPTERLLVYGTGGFAFGRTTSTATYFLDTPLGDSGDSASESTNRTGWTAGAGAEYAIDNHWTFKTEYLYTDLGDEDFLNITEPGFFNATLSSEVKFHTVRVGVNYKF